MKNKFTQLLTLAHMEYGLMLGFNKYIIPFQKDSQKLPFNVAGLDTIKYNNQNLESLAETAIDQAIQQTKQDSTEIIPPDQLTQLFLLSKNALYVPLETEGDRNIFNLGSPLMFNLLSDFSGLKYIYFGNFLAFLPEVIIWRIKKLDEILKGRISSIEVRRQLGQIYSMNIDDIKKFLDDIEIWILCSTDDDKNNIEAELAKLDIGYKSIIYSLNDFHTELMNI